MTIVETEERSLPIKSGGVKLALCFMFESNLLIVNYKLQIG